MQSKRYRNLFLAGSQKIFHYVQSQSRGQGLQLLPVQIGEIIWNWFKQEKRWLPQDDELLNGPIPAKDPKKGSLANPPAKKIELASTNQSLNVKRPELSWTALAIIVGLAMAAFPTLAFGQPIEIRVHSPAPDSPPWLVLACIVIGWNLIRRPRRSNGSTRFKNLIPILAAGTYFIMNSEQAYASGTATLARNSITSISNLFPVVLALIGWGFTVTTRFQFIKPRPAYLDVLVEKIFESLTYPERIGSLIPIEQVGLDGLSKKDISTAFPQLTREEEKYVIERLGEKLTEEPLPGYFRTKFDLSKARRIALEVHGYRYGKISKTIGDANVALDLQITTHKDVTKAKDMINNTLSQMSSTALLLLPQPNENVRKLFEDNLGMTMARVKYISLPSNAENFFELNEEGKSVFNLDLFLPALNAAGYTNTLIATLGKYHVSDEILKQYKGTVLRDIVLLVDWLNNLMGFVMDKGLNIQDIDKMAELILKQA
jgi:hypothetical protein